MDERKQLTEDARGIANWFQKMRVQEGKEPIPEVEVEKAIKRLVETKLGTQIELSQNGKN